MRVLFFGKMADRVGREVDVDAPGGTVGDLRALLATRFPHARDDLLAPSLRACMGDRLVDDAAAVGADDVVEFLPPLSGG